MRIANLGLSELLLRGMLMLPNGVQIVGAKMDPSRDDTVLLTVTGEPLDDIPEGHAVPLANAAYKQEDIQCGECGRYRVELIEFGTLKRLEGTPPIL